MVLGQRIRRFTQAPSLVQAKVLRRLLLQARHTEWGHRYRFDSLARAPDVVAAYQAAMPLSSYDRIADDMQRIRQGAANVLWPGHIRQFAISSGTASAGRLLPLSDEMIRRNIRFGYGAALDYLWTTRNLRVLRGRQISMPGYAGEDSQYPGTRVGEVSGFLLDVVPAQFRFLYRNVPRRIALMPHWKNKIEAVAAHALDLDIRVITTVPTWALALFQSVRERYYQRYGTSVQTIGAIWPNLQLFISGGVALRTYRRLLESIIGLPDMHFMETYGASEGFFAYQVAQEDTSMMLHLDNGIFYEFVRLEDLHSPAPDRFTVADVELGVRYVPHVTTCSGLWAYSVGDVVRFTDLRPPKVQVVGRTAEVLDRYGEKVFGEHVRKVMELACRRSGAHVADFHVTARPPSKARMSFLEWLVEFADPPQDRGQFEQDLDAILLQINRHYQIRRNAGAYGAALLTVLPSGTFTRWLEASRERVNIQAKVPRMSEDHTLADAIKAIGLGRGVE